MMSQVTKENSDPWFAITIPAAAGAEESLTADLFELGFSASEVRESPDGVELVIYVQVPNMSEARRRADEVGAGLIERSVERGAARPATGQVEATIAEVPSEDWTENWKKHFERMPVGRRLEILPPWEDPASVEPGRTAVVINPGLAFGTGRHETTALCLEAADLWAAPGMRVADIGCGSGILAIAALKLGADYAHAVDNDPVAVEAAEENAERNGVGDRINFFVADGPPDCAQNSGIEPFDLVFANIYAEKLVDMSEGLTVCVKSGGRLILSGIESARRNLVEDAFGRNDLPLEMEWQRGEWVTLAFRC
jgi:ribosomal protein L11 methyltransferase